MQYKDLRHLIGGNIFLLNKREEKRKKIKRRKKRRKKRRRKKRRRKKRRRKKRRKKEKGTKEERKKRINTTNTINTIQYNVLVSAATFVKYSTKTCIISLVLLHLGVVQHIQRVYTLHTLRWVLQTWYI